MAEKEKKPQYTTPVGTLLWPRITEASYKFNQDGEFTTSLILAPSTARDKMVALIKEAHEKNKAEQKKKYAEKALPFYEETDKSGEKTGNIIFKFKQRYHIKPMGGGEEFYTKIYLYDSMMNKVNPVKPDGTKLNPWTGTLARICFELNPYSTAAAGTGIGLRPKAVQIMLLVEGGEKHGEDFGFEEEDGWKADKEEELEEVPF